MMGGREVVVLLALCGLVYGQGAEKRRTGNICHVDMDCPDNAFCRQGTYCVCKEGFVYAAINSTDKGCLKEAHFGEECVQHVQCQSTMGTQSKCEDGTCRCNAQSHLEENRCFETALVGERCNVDQNCYLGETGPQRQAYCVRGFCTCPLQSSPRDGGTRCVRDAALGEQCEDQQQCAGPGLVCRDTCKCKENWIAHNVTNICVQAVRSLGEPCEFDVQCFGLTGKTDSQTSAALCLAGVCQCAYTARAAGSPERCYVRKRPGQECTIDEECVSEEDEPGYCLNGHCTCKTCSPDASDFGGASTISRPPVYIAAILSIAAILRH